MPPRAARRPTVKPTVPPIRVTTRTRIPFPTTPTSPTLPEDFPIFVHSGGLDIREIVSWGIEVFKKFAIICTTISILCYTANLYLRSGYSDIGVLPTHSYGNGRDEVQSMSFRTITRSVTRSVTRTTTATTTVKETVTETETPTPAPEVGGEGDYTAIPSGALLGFDWIIRTSDDISGTALRIKHLNTSLSELCTAVKGSRLLHTNALVSHLQVYSKDLGTIISAINTNTRLATLTTDYLAGCRSPFTTSAQKFICHRNLGILLHLFRLQNSHIDSLLGTSSITLKAIASLSKESTLKPGDGGIVGALKQGWELEMLEGKEDVLGLVGRYRVLGSLWKRTEVGSRGIRDVGLGERLGELEEAWREVRGKVSEDGKVISGIESVWVDVDYGFL